MLDEACRQAVLWQKQGSNDAPLVMGVNLSPRQFQDPKLVAKVKHALQTSGLEPGCLKLEITESMMMLDSDLTATTLRELKQIGVHLAIDDFGTGYCSLNYLKRFPVDTLKIDRSFIDGLGKHPEDTAIVHAVITFAKALGLDVTAEGIETPDQLQRLTELDCEHGQGYHFSRPLTIEGMNALLAGDLPWYTAPEMGPEVASGQSTFALAPSRSSHVGVTE